VLACAALGRDRAWLAAHDRDILGETEKWHRWDEVTRRAPLIVIGRTGFSLPPGSTATGVTMPEVSSSRVRELLALGASAVQLGTAFAVTEEGDAHPVFKKVLAEAKPEDIVEFMSVAGLPARAVRTPWLVNYLEKLPALGRRTKPRAACTLAFDCLQSCGLRDGLTRAGQFCIDLQLAAALKGDLEHGLFFRGAGPLPFGDRIRPVRELLAYLLSKPEPAPA
jgi:nitronate monooxygenase